MMLKRSVSLLAMLFGFLGIVACVLGGYGIWWVGARLNQVNDRAFAAVDRSLARARDRVLGVQERVEESKLATDEIGKLFRNWMANQAAERIGLRLEIEGKADKLAQKLHEVDLWLETGDESLRVAQQILEMVDSVGAPSDTASVDELLANLSLLRSSVKQVQVMVQGVGEFTAQIGDDTLAEQRTARAVRLVSRVMVTVTEIDTRLGELASRLSELRASAGRLKAEVRTYIFIATCVGVALFVWMAAGQCALCWFGWKNCGRTSASRVG